MNWTWWEAGASVVISAPLHGTKGELCADGRTKWADRETLTERDKNRHREVETVHWEKRGSRDRDTQRKKERDRDIEAERAMKNSQRTERRVDTQRKTWKQPLESTILPFSPTPTPPVLGGHKVSLRLNNKPPFLPGQQNVS